VLIFRPFSKITCRRCHVLPRVWTCCAWAIEQDAILQVPWNEVRALTVPFVSLGAFVLITWGFVYSVARDFVEAPSQMLENWGWEPKVLKKISSHYETQQPLPDDLIEKLIKRFVCFSRSLSGGRAVSLIVSFHRSRYVNAGLFYLRQLFFATYDIKVHTDKGMHTQTTKNESRAIPCHPRFTWAFSDRLNDTPCSSFRIRLDRLYTAVE
jgi:hypothetical protein